MSKKEKDPGILSVPEVARSLRVDATTVRRWIQKGALEAEIIQLSGTRKTYRVKRETVDALFVAL